MTKYILASGSPRRKEILSMLGISFEVIKSTCSENIADDTIPYEAVKLLAERKAHDVINSLPPELYNDDVILISADTVVSIDNKILGKPRDKADAMEMLQKLSNRTHTVSTGMSVAYISNGIQNIKTYVSESYVSFKNIPEDKINAYINTNEPMDKAGSYAIQGLGACFIDKLEGDFFSVMGLSISQLYDALNSFDITVI